MKMTTLPTQTVTPDTVTYLDKVLPHPDNTYRPVQMIHHYFPKTEKERTQYFETAKQNGLGGFVVNMDVILTQRNGETDAAFRERCLSGYLGQDTQ